MTAAMRVALALALLTITPGLAWAQQSGAPPPQREVELIEPGTAPLSPLRHRFAPGQTARFRARIQSSVQITAGGRDSSVPVPPIVLETEVGPTETPSAGHFRYAFRVTRATLGQGGSPEVRQRLEHDIAALSGTHGVVEIDERGTVEHITCDLPANASQELQQTVASLRQVMGQLLPRFPREPVGVGARWRIRDTVQLPQMSIEIATVYELRRREGDRIDLAVRIERGEGSGGQLPEGVHVDIGGSGRTLMRIGSLATRQQVESRSEVRVPSPAGEARIVMTARQEVTPVH